MKQTINFSSEDETFFKVGSKATDDTQSEGTNTPICVKKTEQPPAQSVVIARDKGH